MIIILLTSNSEVFCQQSFIGVLNKPFYCVGDQVFYNLYMPDGFEQKVVDGNSYKIQVAKEITVSVQLYKGVQFMQQAFKKTPGNSINGIFNLPLDYEAGNYSLVFQIANANEQVLEVVSKIDFPIYNDLTEATFSSNGMLSCAPNNNVGLDMSINVATTNKIRSSNSVNVQLTDASGNPVEASLAVSVLDKNLLFANSDITLPISANQTEINYLPSNKLSISGFATDDKGQGIGENIFGIWSVERNKFNFTKVKNGGSFFVELDDYEGVQQFQFVNSGESLENVNFNLAHQEYRKDNDVCSVPLELISDYLTESRTRRKIDKYFEVEKEVSVNNAPIPSEELATSDISFDLSEYKRFQNIGNFFIELSSSLLFKKEDDESYSATMLNPKSRSLGRDILGDTPLFIIDGLISKNANFVGNLAFDDIQEVDIYNDPKELRKMLNIMGKNGAARLKTKLPEFKLSPEEQADVFTIAGLESGDYLSSISNEHISKDNHVPVFSPHIYWNPSLKADTAGQSNFQFNHSDDVGNFVVIVTAMTSDGEFIWDYAEYEIE